MAEPSETHAPSLLDEVFRSPHVVPPRGQHDFTVIWLHGRGSCGEEFAYDLLTATLTSGKNLREEFLGCRWVFPSSRVMWSTAFQEEIPAWFEAHSLTDIAARQELQVDGLRESVRFISRLIAHEVKLLNGESHRLVLAGISQGAAVCLWILLSDLAQSEVKLGCFIGLSTWLPFAHNVEHVLNAQDQHTSGIEASSDDATSPEFLESIMPFFVNRAKQSQRNTIPILLGHGIDDAYVDIALGRQAASVLTKLGMTVEWREYLGADEEGHWLKEPEEVDDAQEFIRRCMFP